MHVCSSKPSFILGCYGCVCVCAGFKLVTAMPGDVRSRDFHLQLWPGAHTGQPAGQSHGRPTGDLLCSIVSCSRHAGRSSLDVVCSQSSKQQSTTVCAAHTAPGTGLLSVVDRRWFDSEAQLAQLWQHTCLASVQPTCILA